jgi:hypothetical protein
MMSYPYRIMPVDGAADEEFYISGYNGYDEALAEAKKMAAAHHCQIDIVKTVAHVFVSVEVKEVQAAGR